MNHRSQPMDPDTIRESLLQAEVDARTRPQVSPVEDPHWRPSATTATRMTEADEVRYRRILAKLHYGTGTAILEYDALLTTEERLYLQAYCMHD